MPCFSLRGILERRGGFLLLAGLLGFSTPVSIHPHSLQARLSLAVIDENGRPIPGARVTLERIETGRVWEAETDPVGRAFFSDLPQGTYRVRVQKERFYTATLSEVPLRESEALEIVLTRQRELIEVIEVTPATPALDLTQTTAQATLNMQEILALPTPVPRDLRYALSLLPGVVRDAAGNLHVAGSPARQTLTLLDGFNVTHPITGLFEARVSVDAVREVHVQSSRYSAEYGKSSGGVLQMNTEMGDDRFRFSATDFIPSFQNRKGWHVNNWTPRATFSGPLRKKRAWFYVAPEGEYDATIVEELPRGADRNHAWRVSHLAKAQLNASASHLLTFTLLTHRFRSPYEGLSRFAPREATRQVVHAADVFTLRGQIFRPTGLLLEYGIGAMQFRARERPQGDIPSRLFPEGPRGSFFRTRETRAHRLQGILHLTLPSFFWHGRHEVKVGVDGEQLGAREHVIRRPLTLFREDGTRVREIEFINFPEVRETRVEFSFYGQDRWSFSRRGLLELGLRGDWDSLLRVLRWSPRAAASYLLTARRQTRLTGGIGLFHEVVNWEQLLHPRTGRRRDTFYAADGRPWEDSPLEILFRADARALAPPRALHWSVGLEQQLPARAFLSLEFLQKRGRRGWTYVPLAESEPANSALSWLAASLPPTERPELMAQTSARTRIFQLRDIKRERYDALQVTLRWTFREAYPLLASYVRSRARSNAVFDFTLDTLLFGPQAGGPQPWDTPQRFLLWGWLPLPRRFDLAYAVEWRDGYPFVVINAEHRLVEPPRRRLPAYFSVNLHVERRFRIFGLYWALRLGLNNVTNHPNPSTVNNNVDSTQFLTWGGLERRTVIGRIRLLGRR